MSHRDVNAVHTYKRWCAANGVDDVFARIDAAADAGHGHISFVGYLPPAVTDRLECMGYGVYVVDTSTMGDSLRQSCMIAWGG